MLTGIIGNGLAVLLAGLAILAARFRHEIPGRSAADIILTAAIIFMAFSGELARATGVGGWIASVIRWIENLAGPSATVIFALITLGVIAVLARYIVRTAAERGLWLAFALPFLLAIFPVGVFHTLDAELQALAAELANRIVTALGV